MQLEPDADDTAAGAFPCVHEPANFTAKWGGIASPQAGLEAESQSGDKRGLGLIFRLAY